MTIPHLSEVTIRHHATAQSFERGEDYYQNGAVVSLVQRGDRLTANVEGSEYEPYRIGIQFDTGGVTHATCTCPYDYEGWCKHIVATLLACTHNPEQIERRPTLAELLKPLNQEQLRYVLEAMGTEQPVLIDTIDWHINQLFAQPTPQSKQKPIRRTTVDPKPIRQRVQQILYSAAGYWDDDPALDEIRTLLQKVDEFTAQGDGNNALVMLEAMIDAYVESWMNLDGSSGESGGFFEELDATLAEAVLSADLTPAEREAWQGKLEDWQDQVDDYGIDAAFAMSYAAVEQGWDYPPCKPSCKATLPNSALGKGRLLTMPMICPRFGSRF
jgi:uncharacterized Zn finger protein